MNEHLHFSLLVSSHRSVICGRGRECYNHFGNRRLRVLVDMNLEQYIQAKTKLDKTLIVSSIVDTIRGASKTGGFVRQCPDTNEWHEVRKDTQQVGTVSTCLSLPPATTDAFV